ncbi:MAG: urate hydroxylase PuuD, partial [Caldimonas sp.]
YHQQKYPVSPARLPAHLHWSMWESYSTWLTGFALFAVLYLFNASSFLIDRTVFDWSPAAAVVTALAFLVAFWVIYDALCRLFGRGPRGDLVVGVLVFAFVVFASWLSCHLFAGRAAFLLVGAMLATTMTGNVAMVIIPGQRKVVAALRAGTPVDPVHGQRGNQRSVHNTYFTLPVVFAMISNHYGFLYGAPHNWLVLVALMLGGALVRVSFVLRHKALAEERPVPWRYAVAGTLVVVATVGALLPSAPTASAAAAAAKAPPPTFAVVQAIVQQRCAVCHNAVLANKNVRLDSAAEIRAHAQQLYQQAVVLKLMPMNNATQITDAERATLGRWYEAGAPP